MAKFASSLKARSRSLILIGFILFLVGVPCLPLSGKVDLMHMLAGPSWTHPFGTDALGRDFLLRLYQSFWDSIAFLWLSSLGAMVLGVLLFLGLTIAAECSGPAQSVARLIDGLSMTLSAVPLAILTFFWSCWFEYAGIQSVIHATVCVVMLRTYLGLRSYYEADRHIEYWQAHKAMGGRLATRLIRYGMLGHWRMRLGNLAAFHLRVTLLAEVAVSYLGFGTQEPRASVGNILAAHFDTYLKGSVHALLLSIAFLFFIAAVPNALFGSKNFIFSRT